MCVLSTARSSRWGVAAGCSKHRVFPSRLPRLLTSHALPCSSSLHLPPSPPLAHQALRDYELAYEAKEGKKPKKREEWGEMWGEFERYAVLRAKVMHLPPEDA